METKNKLELIIEKEKNHYWGRIEGKDFMPTGQGKTIDTLIKNVKEAVEDYVMHEGENDKYWNKVDLKKIQFELHYDLQSFFEQFEELKISTIARKAGINESLVRQYATGKKYPSVEQLKKITSALRELANKLQAVNLYAA